MLDDRPADVRRTAYPCGAVSVGRCSIEACHLAIGIRRQSVVLKLSSLAASRRRAANSPHASRQRRRTKRPPPNQLHVVHRHRCRQPRSDTAREPTANHYRQSAQCNQPSDDRATCTDATLSLPNMIRHPHRTTHTDGKRSRPAEAWTWPACAMPRSRPRPILPSRRGARQGTHTTTSAACPVRARCREQSLVYREAFETWGGLTE